MANIEKYPYKRIIQLDVARKDAIRRYRFERELLSDSQAMRELLDIGLEAAGRKEPKQRAVRR